MRLQVVTTLQQTTPALPAAQLMAGENKTEQGCIAGKFFTVWGTREALVKWETLQTEPCSQGSREEARVHSNEEAGPGRFRRLI